MLFLFFPLGLQMADDFSVKLRKENEQLLAQLRTGISHLKQIVDVAETNASLKIQKCKEHSERSRAARNIMLKTGQASGGPKDTKQPPKPDIKRKGGKIFSKRTFEKGNMAVTSTPVQNMHDSINMNETESFIKTIKVTPAKEPKSILVTPARKVKTPKQAKLKVTFPSGPSERASVNNFEELSLREKSFLGYDWIAGALDNDSSICEQSDKFFEELKEFRRVNKDECISNFVQSTSAKNETPKSQKKISFIDNKENDVPREDICCGSTYTIDGRLHPVPIHGPYSQCPVCKTKQEPETEYDKSYIRVSVPRSTLQSPYRIKPHRRKSFDPSDSIALSEHCLAGWQSAKPAYAPGPGTLDLQSNVQMQSGLSSVGAGQSIRTGYQRETEELLNKTIAMRHGLQLLERQYDGKKRANTTSYPAF